MSKIPRELQKKVDDYKSGRDRHMAVQSDVEFGYQLSLERIGELEKEVEFWKGKLANCLEAQNNDEENL